MTYKITDKYGDTYYIDATKTEIKSSIFEKIHEAMRFEVSIYKTESEHYEGEDLPEEPLET